MIFLAACILFIFVTYVLLFAWVVVLACCVVMTVFYTMSWGVCNTDEIGWDEGTIDFYPFHFMFPEGKCQQRSLFTLMRKLYEVA